MEENKKDIIIEGESLNYTNLVAYRTLTSPEEVQHKLMALATYMKDHQVTRKGPMISTTHGVQEDNGKQLLDMEFLFPVDQEPELPPEYLFKPVFHLKHAICKRHTGVESKLNDAYQEMEKYMQSHQLQQITPIYNVHTNEQEIAQGGVPVIDVYIGINPSIL